MRPVPSPEPLVRCRALPERSFHGGAGQDPTVTEGFPNPCRRCPRAINFTLSKGLGLV